jgi:hypothetical protein
MPIVVPPPFIPSTRDLIRSTTGSAYLQYSYRIVWETVALLTGCSPKASYCVIIDDTVHWLARGCHQTGHTTLLSPVQRSLLVWEPFRHAPLKAVQIFNINIMP